ncbi:PilZ domain-containing protein [Candidatus Omnitrophota bacterium]
MKQSRTERRQHPRTEGLLPLKISQKGLDVITETKNISCSGVCCRVNKPIPLMTKLGLTLLLPIRHGTKVNTAKVKCKGVVVRSEPTIVEEADTAYQSIAVFFSDLSKKDRGKITEYVLQSFRKDIF